MLLYNESSIPKRTLKEKRVQLIGIYYYKDIKIRNVFFKK